MAKWAKLVDSFTFVALAFQIGLEHHNSDFKMFICNYFFTLFLNLVNFSPVTPDFKSIEESVHPLVFKLNI